MRSHLKVENPDEIEMTLTITMDLKSWRKLKEQIDDGTFTYPANKMRKHIRQMVSLAEQEFNPSEETQ